METQLPDRIFYQDSDFNIGIEEYGNSLLLHCEVFNWKPSVLRRGYSQFARLEKYAKDKGYEKMFTVTPNPKFVNLLCGQTVNRFEYEGIFYEVVIWDLKQQP